MSFGKVSIIFGIIIIAHLFDMNKGFNIVSYVPEWRFKNMDWELASKYSTHIILFSIEVHKSGKLHQLQRLKKMKEIRGITAKNDTKLLLSFGGHGRSNGFPIVSQSDNLIGMYVQNTLKLMRKYKLDGIDLNWEYPTSQKEWEGLFKIIKEFKIKKPEMILTMAFYPKQESILTSNLAKKYDIESNIDMFHMMTYDNMNSDKNEESRHSTYMFGINSINNAISAGMNGSKLTMGVPFYGRHILNGEWKTYGELIDLIIKENPSISDENIFNIDEYNMYYYNGINTMKAKLQFSIEKKLNGIMIWEIGQDKQYSHKYSLLKAINEYYPNKLKSEL